MASGNSLIKSEIDFPLKKPFEITLTSPGTVDISQLSPVILETIGLFKTDYNFSPPQIRSLKMGSNCNG